MDSSTKQPTAAVLIIGDEILSGRTQDANLAMIARGLDEWGIALAEARVVPDETAAIVAAVNDLRAAHTYVITTGGIGPTHDDITADAMGAALHRPVTEHAQALAHIEAWYKGRAEVTPGRRRMARMPQGAVPIDNPVSGAPGFQIENVFVLAGVPKIAEGMFWSLKGRLTGGPPLRTRTIRCALPESVVAEGLGAIQAQFPDVKIGSYPVYGAKHFDTHIVLRHADESRLDVAAAAVERLLAGLKRA